MNPLDKAIIQVIAERTRQIKRMEASIASMKAQNEADGLSLYARILTAWLARKGMERPDTLTCSQIADMTSRDPSTVRGWIKLQGLPATPSTAGTVAIHYTVKTSEWLEWATTNQPIQPQVKPSRAVPPAGRGVTQRSAP